MGIDARIEGSPKWCRLVQNDERICIIFKIIVLDLPGAFLLNALKIRKIRARIIIMVTGIFIADYKLLRN